MWAGAPAPDCCLERRIKRYVTPHLSVLGELGQVPADPGGADILYNILTRRRLARSTVITTNLAFKDLGTVFSGAACVG